MSGFNFEELRDFFQIKSLVDAGAEILFDARGVDQGAYLLVSSRGATSDLEIFMAVDCLGVGMVPIFFDTRLREAVVGLENWALGSKLYCISMSHVYALCPFHLEATSMSDDEWICKEDY